MNFDRQISDAFGRKVPAYRSVNATSRELNTGLNIYRMIDFEPV